MGPNYHVNTAPNVTVKDVVVARTSPTTIYVSWRPLTLSEARGFVTFYSIAYTPTPNSRRRQAPQDTMYVNASADSSSVTIQGLDGDLAYSVTVAGGTRAGIGISSNIVTVEVLPTTTPTIQESQSMLLVELQKNYTLMPCLLYTEGSTTGIIGGAVAGAVIGVILGACILLILFTLIYKR